MGRKQVPEAEKFSYHDWYIKNREEIAKKRQERYENDPEYREKVIARSRYHYWTKQRKNELMKEVDTESIELKADKVLPIHIDNPEDARFGQDLEVPVFNSGELGALLNRSPQTIRLWERREITPKAFWRDPRGYRLYTEDQVIAFLECKHYLDMPMKNIETSVFAREIRKALESMPDGVKVVDVKTVDVTGECGTCHNVTEKEVREYEATHVRCSRCGGALLPATRTIREG